ncbi:MAG: hypothetical protein KF754_03640 [Planctomycetes bacterium]|nr:hypothetical protein [Planctomycetota bacterium]
MRFILMAALIGAVAPLCAQSTLVMPINTTFTGVNQEYAQVIEYQAPAQQPGMPAPMTWQVTLDLHVWTNDASGAHVTLYSASDEYTMADFGGGAPGVCWAITSGAGQAATSHITTMVTSLHRYVVMVRRYNGGAGSLNCTVTLDCDYGVLTQGTGAVCGAGKGHESAGLSIAAGGAMGTAPTFTVNLTLDGHTGAEPCAFQLDLNNVDVQLIDVTGPSPVGMGSWSSTGSGGGTGFAFQSRGLDAGVRQWRFEVTATAPGAFFGIEFRTGGWGRILNASWVAGTPTGPGPTNPPVHYGTSGGGSSGGGGCVAAGGFGLPALPLLLLAAWRRRRSH